MDNKIELEKSLSLNHVPFPRNFLALIIFSTQKECETGLEVFFRKDQIWLAANRAEYDHYLRYTKAGELAFVASGVGLSDISHVSVPSFHVSTLPGEPGARIHLGPDDSINYDTCEVILDKILFPTES